MDCGVGMVRPQKWMVLCKSTSDIFSDLPSHILDRILTRLTIEDIARTSVLSKKWRFRWLSIPQIVFNTSCGKFFQTRSPTTSSIEIWFQIYQILLLHRGPLHTFSLSIPQLVATEDRFITQILFYLTGKDVQKLFLRAPAINQNRLYIIPSTTIFQYEHLTQLTLSNCGVRLPPEFIGFGKLFYLQLHCIDISPMDCQTFISTSPLLQQLRLEEGYRGGSSLLEIDAPNLRVLYFSCISRQLVFKNVPVLSTITIQNYDRSPGRIYSFAEMFRSLPVIESLCIDRLFLACFTAGVIPNRLPSNLKHLKSVQLSRLSFDSLEDVQCAVFLIRSSPNLQKLKLEAYLTNNVPENLQICRTLDEVEDSFNQLKEVMIDFNGTKHELEFIKFLLAKSLALKTFTIQPVRIGIDNLFMIAKAVNQYKRASSNAEIIFLD